MHMQKLLTEPVGRLSVFVVSVSVGFEMGPVRVSIGIESVTDARAKRPNANMQNKQITRRNDLCIVLLSSAVPVRGVAGLEAGRPESASERHGLSLSAVVACRPMSKHVAPDTEVAMMRSCF